MSPPLGEEINDDIATEIRKHMETIITYYDSINTKVTNIQKEINLLKYLWELKKSKSIMHEEYDKQKNNMKLSKSVFGKLKQKRNFEP